MAAPVRAWHESKTDFADRLKAWRKEGRYCDLDRENRDASRGHVLLYRDLIQRQAALRRREAIIWRQMTDEQRLQALAWGLRPPAPELA